MPVVAETHQLASRALSFGCECGRCLLWVKGGACTWWRHGRSSFDCGSAGGIVTPRLRAITGHPSELARTQAPLIHRGSLSPTASR